MFVKVPCIHSGFKPSFNLSAAMYCVAFASSQRVNMTFTGTGPVPIAVSIPDIQTPSAPSRPRTWSEKSLVAQFWTYRLAAYLLLNVVDDPAWLALVFC